MNYNGDIIAAFKAEFVIIFLYFGLLILDHKNMLYIWLISGDLFVESQKLDFDSSLYLVQTPPPIIKKKK